MNILKIQTEMLKEEVKGNLRMLWHRDDDGYLWIAWDGVVIFRIPEKDFHLRLAPRREKPEAFESFFVYSEKKVNHRLRVTDDMKNVELVYSGKARKLLGADDDEFSYISEGYFKMAVKGEKDGVITLWNKQGDNASAVVVKRGGKMIALIAALRIKKGC
jgi:hypothetical protein